MPEFHLYEYAVVRVVPKVEREEFLNIGVILFCKKTNFIEAKFHLDADRINCFTKDLSIEELKINIKAFENICLGIDSKSPIANLDVPSRFRWLTAARSTILQCSKVHPGLSLNLDQTLDKLFNQLVI
ncbi:MAG: DUF3037 domain-containing protein [Oligoflexus sp.]|nr:DUF3037 domain-containing protein [Pseudopedobacter sp.]